MRNRRIARMRVAAFPVIALVSGVAYADEPSSEIVVTAQKKSEHVQDVPIAMTALSGADLTARGVSRPGDLAASVPNLMISSPYGDDAQPTFALRGVTTNDYSENQSSPIAMYVDDIYKSVGALQALQMFDLDRVEVLRGPQGTLYGMNATGGAININSRNPLLDKVEGYATAGLGNYNQRTVEGAIGVPLIGDKLAIRVAGFYEQRDGWMKSVEPNVEPLNGIDSTAGRVTLLYRPSADFTALLKASVSHSGGTPFGDRPINIEPEVTGSDPQLGNFENAALYAFHKDIFSNSVSLKMDWNVSSALTVTSVTGFSHGVWNEKADDGSVGVQIYGPDTYYSRFNAFSQELRLATDPNRPLSVLLGGYFGRDAVHAELEYHYFDNAEGSFVTQDGTTLYGFDQFNSFDQIKTAKAIFANGTWRITSRLKLQAGIRYNHDSVTIRNFYALEGGLSQAPTSYDIEGTDLWTSTIPYVSGVSGVDFQSGTSASAGTVPAMHDGDSNVSFKGGLDWKITPQVMAYGSVSRGFRGAAFNAQAFNDPSELTFAKPEELTDYEAGVKSTLFGRLLQANLTAFLYDYRNQQFLDTFGSGGTLYHVINAPRSRVVGAELELRLRPTHRFELSGNLAVMNAKYRELTLRDEDLSGNTMLMSPKFNAELSADWHPIGGLTLHVDGNYRSLQYFDAFNTARIAQPGYATLNGRLGYDFGRYQLSVWAKNLTNKAYTAYAIAIRDPGEGGMGFDYTTQGEPRMYGVTATMHF